MQELQVGGSTTRDPTESYGRGAKKEMTRKSSLRHFVIFVNHEAEGGFT